VRRVDEFRRRVAVVGVGTTDYSRHQTKSRGGLAVDACVAALRDAGLTAPDVDGIAGDPGEASPHYVQGGLGVDGVRWFSTTQIPLASLMTEAAYAVHSGACEVALVYHAAYRTGSVSQSARQEGDPIRAAADPIRRLSPHHAREFYAPYGARSAQYAGMMRRYLHEFGGDREGFGLAAINSRSHARRNPHAVMRKPLSMEEYLAATPVREPMTMFDMDLPIDGADALVLTTAERARDMPHAPVYLEAVSFGAARRTEDDLYRGVRETSAEVAAAGLWSRTQVRRAEVDLLYAYDGYTLIVLKWLEALGFCEPGTAGKFLAEHWDARTETVSIDGRIPMNTHGGNLSEGASQGAGQLREAVLQLRGEAGERQRPDARTALLGNGGLLINSNAMVLTNVE
jgi:acetyl-CoA acetyltransferase